MAEKESSVVNDSLPAEPPQSYLNIGRYWFAFLLIFAGIVLLLINLGLLPFGYWLYLVQFWPALLIFFGLDLVFRRQPWLRWLLFVLGILFFVGTIFWSALLFYPACGMMPWVCF